MFHNRYGLAGLLKEGHRSFTGIDEVTQRNIEAARALSEITRTSLGPNSLSKLMVNTHGKRVITADASVIVRGLEVQHPAARLVAFAADMQSEEFGGGVNFLLVVAGQLLSQAEYLLKQGLHQTDVIRGYEKALAQIPAFLEECVCETVTQFKDVNYLANLLKPAVATKPLCAEGQLHRLVAEAAVLVSTADPSSTFDVENIRVAKLTGGCLSQSLLLRGMVVTRIPSGTATKKENCKVMVLGCGLECTGTEAKGTVLVHNAEELKNFAKGEERQMEEIIKKIKDAGVEVIIVHGGAISDVAQHFCNKYEILTLKVQSKFETRRLCRALGATAVVRLAVPTAEELGTCVSVTVAEVASKKVTNIITKDTRVCTLVLRGSTPAILEEAERAVDDAANLFKALTRDGRLVAGAGAVEMELTRKLQKFGAELPGVEQYAVMKFGEVFEAIPRLLAESSGRSATEVLAALHAAHQQGRTHEGVNTNISLSSNIMRSSGSTGETRSSGGSEGSGATGGAGESTSSKGDLIVGSTPALTINAKDIGVLDHMVTKQWAIKLAADAALTVLQVDQIIMARPAGGPAPHHNSKSRIVSSSVAAIVSNTTTLATPGAPGAPDED